MKIIVNISKSIFIICILLMISILLVALTIDNNYEKNRVCRNNSFFDKKNYEISNVLSIEVLSQCDKIKLYIVVDNYVTSENINGIILQIANKKKEYNDLDKMEIIIKNDELNYLIFIDENESIDIDFID